MGSSTYGVATTLSVTISAVTGGAVPTGSVAFQFTDKTSTIFYICAAGTVQTQACVVPPDGTGKASVTTSNLPVGADNLTATYSGDTNYAGGEQTAIDFSMSQANAQTMLSITLNSSGIPPGTVQFVL